MVQTADLQVSTENVKGKLVTIYDYLISHKDGENADKVKELARKLENREFVIAFCGHFSAGKSTMINQLIGESLLPSSPIPTSANLVKVRSGDEYAKVFFKNEKPRLYIAPYDYETVKNYCKDGDQIKEIEISHRASHLPENTVIMDTPGIDSADDAHRIATESALHLADLIFYVMDYNHVQSELNFLFTKELSKAGKEVYLVINQIDKHSDEELSFQTFQTTVTDSFASWGVKPAAIFYTSLKKPDDKLNQFKQLKEFIGKRLHDKDQLLIESVFNSLRKISRDHLQFIQKEKELSLAPFRQILNELAEKEQENLSATYMRIHEELMAVKDGSHFNEKNFEHEMTQMMDNAYLMPFQTRELAQAYLESCQPEFKVGILFTKQKTIAERQARLERFYQDIFEKTTSQLAWHLREYMLRVLKEKRLDSQELLARVQEFSIPFSPELLAGLIKPGARLSGDYVLQYTDEVATEIKRMAKTLVSELKNILLGEMENRNKQLQEKLEMKDKSMERYLKAYEALTKERLEREAAEIEMEALLLKTNGAVPDRDDLFDQTEEEFEVIYSSEKNSGAKLLHESKQPKIIREIQQPTLTYDAGSQIQSTANRMKRAARLIHPLPGFQKLAEEMDAKAGRLSSKGFTIALFGAFSAGKSSFANALMGEKVLPVSPNPTTAAINKIKPVNHMYPHGTVMVKVKASDAMLEDINKALKVFGFAAENFDEALDQLEKISQQNNSEEAAEKINYNFLQAFKRGYPAFMNQLDTVVRTNLQDFHDYVAKEEKSCFVEWIDLYFDCPLTRKGITIVDTPGADSINARHTGVAFNYIKNSDAILFVTYYNHAFSKADREFLIQLGRVKDVFQLDKMFFVVNAIDLAENEEEKEMVISYVSEQLLKFGIRNPNIHGLSSLLALKEKQQQTEDSRSGMRPFENAFYQFIANDLTKMAIASSKNELTRIEEMIEKLIQSVKEDQTVKQQKIADIERQKANITQLMGKQSSEIIQKRLDQEIEELIYYIKQRTSFRFSDFFKEAFNPAVLHAGVNVKKALSACLEELLEAIGFDLAQEMRATTVRVERMLNKLFSDFQTGFMERLREINQDLSFSVFELRKSREISFQTAFSELNRQLFTKALSYFKNPKSFFEKNEKKLVAEAITSALDLPTDEYLQQEKNRLSGHYAEMIEIEFTRLIAEMSGQAADFYLSMLSALDGGVTIEELMKIREQLNE